MGGRGGNALNRTLDVAIAGAGLALASPFLAAAAIAVKLGDGGPVLFKQTRVGKDGRDFELLKLRTRVVDAEKQGAGYADILDRFSSIGLHKRYMLVSRRVKDNVRPIVPKD